MNGSNSSNKYGINASGEILVAINAIMFWIALMVVLANPFGTVKQHMSSIMAICTFI
ncbi:hypothetical protein LguiA_012265 [Lonicera macranthoides]